MDKLWSILPMIYLLVVLIKGTIANGFNARLLIMTILVFIWGSRLTYNFAKKGGYSIKFWEGEEDYRWAFLRQNKYFQNKFIWGIFDLFFISFYQNFVVLLMTLPAVAIMEASSSFNYYDLIPTLLTLGFIVLETASDKEQLKFYNKRKELMKDGTKLEDIEAPYNKGFNTMGIHKYSRHPNYLAEQAIWVSIYLFTISAGVNTYYVFNPTIVGCLLVILIFLASSSLAESISMSKYPLYKEYIKTTSKYIPWFNKKAN